MRRLSDYGIESEDTTDGENEEMWDMDLMNLGGLDTVKLDLTGIVEESGDDDEDDLIRRISKMNATSSAKDSLDDIRRIDKLDSEMQQSQMWGAMTCISIALLMCTCASVWILMSQEQEYKLVLDNSTLSKTLTLQVREACNASCSGTEDCSLSNLAGSCLEMQEKICDKFDSSANVKVLGHRKITLDCRNHSRLS